jgi:hypothetical protein
VNAPRPTNAEALKFAADLPADSRAETAEAALATGVERSDAKARQFTEEVDVPECDHDWELVDESFYHEFGIEQVYSWECQKCGLVTTKCPFPPDFE